MKPLAPDEKAATVMVYTQDMLVRGDIVVKEAVRVSILPRTQGTTNFFHLHNAQSISFTGTPPKNHAFSEIFVPAAQVIGFHLAPPAHDPLDYDTTEVNRAMKEIQVVMGPFIMKAKIRYSAATDLATSLEVLNTTWASLYEAEVTSPYLAQFSVTVPMLLVSPSKVTMGLA
jgi:hypothetical protein